LRLKLEEDFVFNIFFVNSTKITTVNAKRIGTLEKISLIIDGFDLFNHKSMRFFFKDNNVRYVKFGKIKEFNAEDPLPILKKREERMTRNLEESNHGFCF
jgi:hypothetical protein